MIDLFSVFEVIEPQGNYIEESYGPGEYTWMLIVTFPTLHVYFIYISNMYIFATLMKYILEPL